MTTHRYEQCFAHIFCNHQYLELIQVRKELSEVDLRMERSSTKHVEERISSQSHAALFPIAPTLQHRRKHMYESSVLDQLPACGKVRIWGSGYLTGALDMLSRQHLEHAKIYPQKSTKLGGQLPHTPRMHIGHSPWNDVHHIRGGSSASNSISSRPQCSNHSSQMGHALTAMKSTPGEKGGCKVGTGWSAAWQYLQLATCSSTSWHYP